MEKTNFDGLLERYVKDQVSEEERVKIDAWLDAAKTKNRKNLTWSKEDEEILYKKITSKLDNVDEIVTLMPQGYWGGAHRKWIIGIAATIAIVLTASYLIWLTVLSPGVINQSLATQKIILNDGTIVWMNPAGSLIYTENVARKERHATLTGEGLFEVAKDPSRPFIIDCEGLKVKVLGTSFHIRSDSGKIELEVLTGRVNLSSESDSIGINVEAKNRIVYEGKPATSVETVSQEELNMITKSTDYNMQFSNSTLKEIFGRIEKKFDVQVHIEDAHLNTCRLTADFTDHSLESTLEMISEVLDFEYSIEGKTVKAAGAGCQ